MFTIYANVSETLSVKSSVRNTPKDEITIKRIKLITSVVMIMLLVRRILRCIFSHSFLVVVVYIKNIPWLTISFVSEVMILDALLEIYLEDLPPSEFPSLLSIMKEDIESLLKYEGIPFSSVKVGMTVRRLYVILEGLLGKPPSKVEERKGPPERIAYKDGKPTKALEGFLKKFSASQEDVVLKDGYVYIRRVVESRSTKEILSDIFPKFISSLRFRKPMRWGEGKYEFVRPVHGVVSLIGDEVVEFDIFGLRSSNVLKGHRFFGKEEKLSRVEEYEEVLRRNFVVADIEDRKRMIKEQLNLEGLDVDEDEELIDEVTYLTEYPRAVVGSFKEEYLKLPQEVIITTVKHHERTFATFKDGKITTTFVGFQDGHHSEENVRRGFERVINARLEDARYYYEKDLKASFDEWNEELKEVVFQKELGTLFDKVIRIRELSIDLAKMIGYLDIARVERAAMISKSDTVSKVVYEFPELQGVMGRIYALEWGEDYDVAWAVQEQYSDDPRNELGGIIGVADRIDTIVGNFSIGNIPSGSKDPYGLRTKADAVYSIIRKFRWDIDVTEFLNIAFDLLKSRRNEEELYKFMEGRFQAFLEGRGTPWDVARAVVHLWKTPLRGTLSAEALAKIVDSPDVSALRVGFERVHNMTSKHESRKFDGALLREKAEVDLMNEFLRVKSEVEKSLENLDYDSAYRSLISLKPYIDRYFDEVFVMVGREDLRRSRLGFLKNVDDLFMSVANLAEISKNRLEEGRNQN